MTAYHDFEWGVPVRDDRKFFEMLILEGAQAGLSWDTILSRRPNYLLAFDNFEPEVVAAYSDDKLLELLQDPGIIRNRLKVRAARTNAQAFIRVQTEFGSFSKYVWTFVDDEPIVGGFRQMNEVPVTTKESDALSKDLKRRGFTFVGSVIMYAFMQATGLVNDHLVTCPRFAELSS